MSAPSTPGTPAPGVGPETVQGETGAVGTPSSGVSPSGAAPSTAAQAAGPLGQDEIDALQVALGAEQAAVYAYPLVTANDQDDKDVIAQIIQGHRTRRDQTEERLTQGGATPAQSAAAYQPATPVTDQGTARQLAQDIEFDCAAAWRVVIGSTDQAELRGFALAGLSDAAVRLAQWKVLAGVVPSTVPFPGQG